MTLQMECFGHKVHKRGFVAQEEWELLHVKQRLSSILAKQAKHLLWSCVVLVINTMSAWTLEFHGSYACVLHALYYWPVNKCFIVDRLAPRQSTQWKWRFVNRHVIYTVLTNRQTEKLNFDTKYITIPVIRNYIKQHGTVKIWLNLSVSL
jgi:hypothetical protein